MDEEFMKIPLKFFVIRWVFLIYHTGICLADRQQDAAALMDFKLAISDDPFQSLQNWDMMDEAGAPCDWNGITCDHNKQVIILSLPGMEMSGEISSSLGRMPNLQRINLRSNNLSGEIPPEIGDAASLHKIILSGNRLSGDIPVEITNLSSLEILDLANNRLNGRIPGGIGKLRLEQLDLSRNLLTGSIPAELGSLSSLQGPLNLSRNFLTGDIPPELARLPRNASLDLRWNKLSGKIPPQLAGMQSGDAFLGNPGLCGEPLANPCANSSSNATGTGENRHPPGISSKNPPNSTARNPSKHSPRNASNGLSVKQILAIAVGDAVGIALLGLIFIYCCRRRKPCDYFAKRRRRKRSKSTSVVAATIGGSSYSFSQLNQIHQDHQQLARFEKHEEHDYDDEEQQEPDCIFCLCCICCCCFSGDSPEWLQDGELVSFDDSGAAKDSEKAFNLDDLLRASAYVISKTGSSIVYKTVLDNGLTLAVRRLANDNFGGNSKRQKEFDSQVQILGRIKHPCIVKLRAYYSGPDEKLLVYDYIANGSLATALHRPAAPYSLASLTWTERLRIAKRVSQGLAHIHECGPRKYIHGDIRPKNILLSSNMEAFISDFGLSRLITITGSAMNSRSGSRNGSASISIATSVAAAAATTTANLTTIPSSSTLTASGVPSLSVNSGTPVDVEDRFKNAEESAAYRPPESMTATATGSGSGLRRPTQKWDVYAFGVVMLELLSGKKATAAVAGETATAAGATTTVAGSTAAVSLVEWAEKLWESKRPVHEVMDPSLTHGAMPPQHDVAEFLRIALSCVAASPDHRPKMKQVVDSLRKVGGGSSNAP